MARLYLGTLDGPSGVAGPVVWCHGKKRNAYVRSFPLAYRDKRSVAQLENRARMKAVMAFLSQATEFVNHNMDHLTKNESATNRAMKMNFHEVEIGTRVIGGRGGGRAEADYANSRPRYEKMRLSEGEQFGLDSAMVLLEGGELVLAWNVFVCEKVSAVGDRVNVLVFNATRQRGKTVLHAAERREGVVRIGLPERWEEDELHVYVSVSNRMETRFSDSQHFGVNLERGLKKAEEKLGGHHSAIKVLSECYESGDKARLRRGKDGGEKEGGGGNLNFEI